MRVLILGGTTEASELARLIAGDDRFEATLSLAGRTSLPKTQPIAMRTGGFGGVDGLAGYLAEHTIDSVVDATHPYAARISANAVAACTRSGVPLVSVVRPAWMRQSGDTWHDVPSTAVAVQALGPTARRVFLSLGRQELHLFAAAPQHHYLARLIELPGQSTLPPDLALLRQRGPFDRAAEQRLFQDEKVDVIVSKNAGGRATYAKLEAARLLGLPVIMIARPDKPAGIAVTNAVDAMARLVHDAGFRSLRGV